VTPVPARPAPSGPNPEALSAIVVDAAYHLYRALGPGMLESVYERALAHALERRGCRVQRQLPVDFYFEGMLFRGGFRVDLLVNDTLIVEVKSTEIANAAHVKQTLTYMRLLNHSLGLLLNFGAPRFRDVVRRVVNRHDGEYRASDG
jgi:iron complex transport system substrate-binding protein